MKLRNKKTGEIADLDDWTLTGANDRITVESDHDMTKIFDYNSLAELNEEWEDYKPTEPLIKDEKIRKAIRAWAEINLILDDDDVEASTPTVDCNVLTLTYGTISIDVFVNDTITIINHGHYTITELCGEDEE